MTLHKKELSALENHLTSSIPQCASSQLQMIADDLVIAKIPSFSTVMAFDG